MILFATTVDLANKNLQILANPNSRRYAVYSYLSLSPWVPDDRTRAKFKIMFDGYRKMFDQSISKSKDLGDILTFLPGVVVQKEMSIQGMADLYRTKPDLLKSLIKSTIKPLRLGIPHVSPNSGYILDGYLSGFLQDRHRSQLYYCDPMLQHLFICRHLLSLLDGSNAFDLHSYVFRLSLVPIFLILTF